MEQKDYSSPTLTLLLIGQTDVLTGSDEWWDVMEEDIGDWEE